MSEQCPNSKSIPQINQETGEIAYCFNNNCAEDYSCQFSKLVVLYKRYNSEKLLNLKYY